SIASIPGQITSGQITAAEARPVSIVGISQVGGYFLQESIEQQRPIEILNYLAIISIALGFTNLLPLPALDGGRILFVLIEMVRGKPIPPERESVVHLLGLAFLLSLTVVIVINDIINPVTDLIR
ncbi:MAG: site-2 protease family protein, partial [Chloroflexota bacterium]